MGKITFIWVIWWLPVFIFETGLTLASFGMYLGTPSNELLIAKANRWFLKKSISHQANKDPKLKASLTELGWYKIIDNENRKSR